MKGLELPSGTIELFISGHSFTIKADSSFAETLSQLSEDAEYRAMLASESGSYSKTTEFLCYIIDTILGKGSVEAIFSEAEPNVFDLCEIIDYVCDEFSKYRKNRLDRLYKGITRGIGAKEAVI